MANKSAKAPAHPKYIDMIIAALTALKSRTGSSRQAIEKYIRGNYQVGDGVGSHLKLALRRGVTAGKLVHTKGAGASGSFRVVAAAKPKKPVTKSPAKPKAKPATPKKKSKPATPAKKKPAAKKVAKKPAKKPAAKKPAAKPAKKPAAKPKVAAKSKKTASKAKAKTAKKTAKSPKKK